MKIVVDTNILVSGIFWPGNPHKILDLWVKNKIQLLVSKSIFTEYVRIIEKLSVQCDGTKLGNKWISFLSKNIVFIDAPQIYKECPDPDDNKFVDCAVAGQVKFIISGDKHLLTLENVFDIPIVSAATFLKLFSPITER